MLEGYFDESADSKKKQVFGIGGMVAPAKMWDCFWGAWDRLLDKHKISVFHSADIDAQDCEMYSHLDAPARAIVRNDFTRLVVDTDPKWFVAHATVVLMEPYNRLRPRIKAVRGLPSGLAINGDLVNQYFLGMEHTLLEITEDMDRMGVSSGERLGSIFDQNSEVSGKALGLFKILKSSNVPAYRDRLGALAFNDKRTIKPLQAADLIAYEYVRHARDSILGDMPERPQFTALRARFGEGWVFGEQALSGLVDYWEAQP
jgi:hypothetical protein